MKSFKDLGIDPIFIEKLAQREIREPTSIQTAVIPSLLSGRNILFRSATGTGKTFAYLIPILQNALKAAHAHKGPAILVCAPTYELCSQIKREADLLLKGSSACAILLTGSANISRQIENLKKDKPLIVIGNPGRLHQLARMGKLFLGNIKQLVIDEADRLTADEIWGEMTEFLELLPTSRLTAVCSATLPPRARDRLMPFMGTSPLREEMDNNEVMRELIEHWAFYSETRKKVSTLLSLIHAVDSKKALVFLDRSGQVGNIVGQLQHHKMAAAGLIGDMRKQDRKKAIDDFRSGRVKILVTSDLSARGLDLPNITHVIALDVPQTADAYTHRAGRTARAGRRGVMVTIGDGVELPRLAMLEKKLGIIVYPKELYQGAVVAPELLDGEEDRSRG